eukprot:TRINITY_DN30912_c0_g1_i2.p1 TRINITY_DN30912_c0_g1~~TRINITY_DN30912_c0_g1_i2.p1  ORF type:complete len:298 (+),score=32.31 TRINITY_DN30912_c0_g1_i2:40-933(+)
MVSTKLSNRCNKLRGQNVVSCCQHNCGGIQRRNTLIGSTLLLNSLITSRSSGIEGSSWQTEDERRLLHAVLRVGDIDKSFEFYEKELGMQKLRFRDLPEEGYSNGFVGYGSELSYFSLEFSYTYGLNSFRVGEDVQFFVSTTSKENGVYKDPTGYKWNNTSQAATAQDPLSKIQFQVSNLEKSAEYYKQVMGMSIIEQDQSSISFTYTNNDIKIAPVILQLVQKKDGNVDKGDAYVQIAVSTKNVFETSEQIKQNGGKVVREAGPVPGIGTKIVATVDPDGWKYVFVDNSDFLKELQ